MDNLEDHIARWRADADVVRRNGNASTADVLARCATEAEEASQEWLTWLTETEAAGKAGRARRWMRARFTAMKADGHAKLRPSDRERLYRACAVLRDRAAVRIQEAPGREAARAFKDRQREQRKHQPFGGGQK